MAKLKNCNIIMAVIFSAVGVILALFRLLYVADKYPFSTEGILMFVFSLLLLTSALLLTFGTIFSKKKTIIASSIFLFIYSVLHSFYYLSSKIAYDPIRFFYGQNYTPTLITFLFLLFIAFAFFFTMLYLCNLIKNSTRVFAFLFISWLITIFTSGISSPQLYIITAIMLLMKYTDIANPRAKVKMGEIFVLSTVTFAVYYIIWCVNAVKKVNLLLEKKSQFSELYLFSLFTPYSAYWYYTRYGDLKKANLTEENRGTICMTLSLLFCSPIALCILQRDLNALSESFDDVKEDISVPEEIESSEVDFTCSSEENVQELSAQNNSEDSKEE